MVKVNKDVLMIKESIIDYVRDHAFLVLIKQNSQLVKLQQPDDKMELTICFKDISNTHKHVDYVGQFYLQINMKNGLKLLLAEKVIGFEAMQDPQIKQGFLPDVVTTLDLLNIMEAFENSLKNRCWNDEEQFLLERAFHSITEGAVKVGFDVNHLEAPFPAFGMNSPILH